MCNAFLRRIFPREGGMKIRLIRFAYRQSADSKPPDRKRAHCKCPYHERAQRIGPHSDTADGELSKMIFGTKHRNTCFHNVVEMFLTGVLVGTSPFVG
jgi:hypothetical protein